MTSLSPKQYKLIQEVIIESNESIKEKGGTLFWTVNASDSITIDILLGIIEGLKQLR